MTKGEGIESLKSIAGVEGDCFGLAPLNPSASEEDTTSAGLYRQEMIFTDIVRGANKHAWLRNGRYDNLPNIRRDLYRKSSIHNSAINIKTNLIGSAPLEFERLEEYYSVSDDGTYELVEAKLSDSEFQNMVNKAQAFSRNIGLENYKMKAAHSLAIHGEYYGVGFYKPSTNAENSLYRVAVNSPLISRLGAEREYRGHEFVSKLHYFCDSFYNASPLNVKTYKEYQNLTTNQRRNKVYYMPSDDGSIYKSKKSSHYTFSKHIWRETEYRDFYGTPDYESEDAINYIDIDYLISAKDYTGLASGFTTDHIIVRYRAPKSTSEEEKKAKEKDLEFLRKHKGPFGEKSMVMWVSPKTKEDGTVQAPDPIKIIEIPHQNNADRLNILREERGMKILSSHNIVSGEIIGMPEVAKRTGFASQSEYLIAAQKQLYTNVIQPYKKLLVEDIQRRFILEGIIVKPVIPNRMVNFMALTDKMMRWMFSRDEVRAMHGHGPMAKEVAEEVIQYTEREDHGL